VITKICFATANAHKLGEVKKLLPEYDVLGLTDIGCSESIPEDFDTLKENSLQKARFVSEKFGVDCFADDSGLEVEALHGAPGVHSAYYGGPERDAQKNMTRLLRDLGGASNRKARFVTVITLIVSGNAYVFEGELRGTIAEAPRGSAGFGYDPIFIPDGETRTIAEMSSDEKNRISHRAVAVQKLVDQLKVLI